MYSAFSAVKRDINFSARYVKGVPFFNRRYTKSVPSLSKVVYKRVGRGGGLSVKSNIRAFNTYMEIKQVKEKVHDSRRSSTAFRDQRFCLFKSRSSGLHLETRLDDLDVIVNPGYGI